MGMRIYIYIYTCMYLPVHVSQYISLCLIANSVYTKVFSVVLIWLGRCVGLDPHLNCISV